MGSDVFLILSHYLALPCLTIISILGFRAVVLGEGGGGIVLLLKFSFRCPIVIRVLLQACSVLLLKSDFRCRGETA